MMQLLSVLLILRVSGRAAARGEGLPAAAGQGRGEGPAAAGARRRGGAGRWGREDDVRVHGRSESAFVTGTYVRFQVNFSDR